MWAGESMTANLYSHFLKTFNRDPERIGLITHDKKAYSYKQIKTISSQMANALKKIGAAPGDRIITQIEKSPYNFFLYLACLQSGIIYAPLNTGYTFDELRYFIGNAKPKLVVYDPAREEIFQQLCKGENEYLIYSMDESGNGSFQDIYGAQNQEFKPAYSNSDDVAVIIYTSGTTGQPKGAMLTHGGLLDNAISLNKAWGIIISDTILHALPLFHVHGLFFACHTALLCGATLIFLPKFDANLVLENLHLATVFMGVPTYYSRLLSEPKFNRESCKNMRLFTSGSAPLLESMFHEFIERTGHTLLERYGMTETGINSSNPLFGKRRVGTVGLAIPGINIRISSDAKKIANTEEAGEIQIKGKNLFKGYWRMPEKTMQDFTEDGYFKTGDVGVFDKDGYLSITGRIKDMIITGGLKVYPKEIEHTINLIVPGIEAAVIGVPHPDFGEAVTAIIAKEPWAQSLTENTVIEHLRKHHANYKIPKQIYFVSQLPKNKLGKVQKNILREKYKNIF